MTLVKFRNSNPSFPSLFNDLFNHDMFPFNREYSSVKTPAVNIKEDKEAFYLELAAPGLTKNDFKVELNENVLSISAQNEKEHKEEKDNYSRIEFNFSSFTRSFTLPESADAQKINANYNDGILKLSIPKKEEAKVTANRLIEIK
jgi:HSP20 family protein